MSPPGHVFAFSVLNRVFPNAVPSAFTAQRQDINDIYTARRPPAAAPRTSCLRALCAEPRPPPLGHSHPPQPAPSHPSPPPSCAQRIAAEASSEPRRPARSALLLVTTVKDYVLAFTRKPAPTLRKLWPASDAAPAAPA